MLIYSVMLVSSVQQSDSYIHTYIYIYIYPFSDSVPLYDRLLQDIKYSSLCYTSSFINNWSICETHGLVYYIRNSFYYQHSFPAPGITLVHSRESIKICGVSKWISWLFRDAEEKKALAIIPVLVLLWVQNCCKTAHIDGSGSAQEIRKERAEADLEALPTASSILVCFLHLEKQMCLPDPVEAWKLQDLEVTTSWSLKLPGWFIGQPQLWDSSLPETQPRQCSYDIGLWSRAKDNNWQIMDSHIVYAWYFMSLNQANLKLELFLC